MTKEAVANNGLLLQLSYKFRSLHPFSVMQPLKPGGQHLYHSILISKIPVNI